MEEQEPVGPIKKGALHKQLGLPHNYKFKKSELVRLRKIETGDKFVYKGKTRKMTALLKKRINFAINFGFRD